MHTPEADYALSTADYIVVLRRHRMLIASVALVGAALAFAYSVVTPESYVSTAQVLVKPITANPLEQFASLQSISMDTEREIARSSSVAEIAASSLGWEGDPRKLAEAVSIESPPESQILEISFASDSPSAAQQGAQAFAAAYLEFKTEQAREASAALTRNVQAQIADLQAQLEEATEQFERAPNGSIEAQELQSTRDALVGQIALLQSRLAGLGTPQIDPGDIIAAAFLPAAAASPKPLLNIVVGVFLGALFGVVLAFVRERTNDRVRGRREVEGALNAPVLAAIPRPRRRSNQDEDLRRGRLGPQTEPYRLVAAELLRDVRNTGARSFVVTGPHEQEPSADVAARLAIVLARSGNRVVLVDVDIRNPQLHELFVIGNDPGLVDHLERGLQIADVVTFLDLRNLALVPAGTSREDEPADIQPHQVQETLQSLLRVVDLAILRIPPVLSRADAAFLGPLVDGALTTVDARRTSTSALTRLRRDLDRSGTRLLGAVVVNADLADPEWTGGGGPFEPPTALARHMGVAEEPGRGREPFEEPQVRGWPL